MEEREVLVTYEAALMSSTTKVINANENLIRLSERLGRLILKFEKLDHKTTGLFPWITRYQSIKDDVNAAANDFQMASNEVLKLVAAQKITLNASMTSAMNTYNSSLFRCYSKIEVLDDILRGLLEGVWDDAQFEAMQKEKIEKAVKDVIEKTKKLPEGMYT